MPNTIPTGGSTGADLNGAAVLDACEQLNARLRPYKWDRPEGKWFDWVEKAFEDRVNLAATGIYNTSKVRLKGAFDYRSNKIRIAHIVLTDCGALSLCYRTWR